MTDIAESFKKLTDSLDTMARHPPVVMSEKVFLTLLDVLRKK